MVVIRGKWKHDKQRQKEYFIGLARNKGFHPEKEPHRWTEVSVADISKYNEKGKSILRLYGGNIKKAIVTLFPTISLQQRGRWKGETQKHRDFFDTLASHKGFHPIEQPNEWAYVTRADVAKYKGGLSIIKLYGGLINAIKTLYPRARLGEDTWTGNIGKQRHVFDKIAQDKGFHPVLDSHCWNDVTMNDVAKREGGALIVKLHGGLRKAISALYPVFVHCTAARFKQDDQKQLEFLEFIAKSKSFHPSEQSQCWKNVRESEVTTYKRGKQIVVLYGGLQKAIKKFYSPVSIEQYWIQNPQQQKIFFDQVAFDRCFHPTNEPYKWKDVNAQDVHGYKGGKALLRIHGSLTNALLAVYNSLSTTDIASTVRRVGENILYDCVASLFCSHHDEMIVNARKRAHLRSFGGEQFPNRRQAWLELDVWIPSLNIAFEYQDKHHYIPAWYANEPLEEYLNRK